MKCKECGQEKPVPVFKAGDFIRYKGVEGSLDYTSVYIVTDRQVAGPPNNVWAIHIPSGAEYRLYTPFYTRVHGYIHITREEKLTGEAGSWITRPAR